MGQDATSSVPGGFADCPGKSGGATLSPVPNRPQSQLRVSAAQLPSRCRNFDMVVRRHIRALANNEFNGKGGCVPNHFRPGYQTPVRNSPCANSVQTGTQERSRSGVIIVSLVIRPLIRENFCGATHALAQRRQARGSSIER